MLFRDRREAGRRLAERLRHYAGRDDVVVLALPRGGIPVGYEVTRELGAPLDVFVVRKLGLPGHPEFAMGAIASGGVAVLNQEVINAIGLPEDSLREVIAHEWQELARREHAYRQTERAPPVTGRTVILVDDGLATGSTMLAAIAALRKLKPARIVVAVPVAAPETCEAVGEHVDEIVCAETPEPFRAVGLWYEDFSQTSDEEVQQLLSAARARAGEEAHP
jgi:putative phosphoribosyl transferase